MGVRWLSNKLTFRKVFASAWLPNPVKLAFYTDLPVKNGQVQPDVIDRWIANWPLVMPDQHITNIRQLQAIAFNAGNKDKSIAASIQVLDSALNNYHIKHAFKVYEGDHLNRIAERITKKMLPFIT